ncbi:MAG: 50S ribosomal protein L15 [Chlamydiales bacterium]
MNLSNLKNSTGTRKKPMRVGRGTGCKKGKTCGKGTKGQKARQGYKSRYGKEGGQLPLYQKLPCRGFTRGRFHKEHFAINLDRIEEVYNDGETVNFETLIEKGFVSKKLPGGLKVIGNGDLKKKVKIEANRYSKSAVKKLEKSGIEYTTLTK